jgi:tellurite resistance protein TerC
MDISWFFIIVQLIFLEGLLSIDNAAVLGAMVAPLPNDEPVPWPRWLAWLGQRLDPILGAQQDAALKVGLLGAYAGRGLMLFIASWIVQFPWLQFAGGAYLVYLGIEHLGISDAEEEAEKHHVALKPDTPGFWQVVLMVELADLVFSLDNVVAAVALSDHIAVVLIGVALGIVALRFAATYFAMMVEREPILLHAAYVLVLVIGLRFCIEQIWEFHISHATQFGVSIGILALAWLYAHWAPMRVLQPLVHRTRRLIYQVLKAIRQLFSFGQAKQTKPVGLEDESPSN